MRFRFIAAAKAHHSLSLLCRCLRVTRSGYYAWQDRPESARATRDRQLKVLVHASFAASKGRYGSPRIHEDLREQEALALFVATESPLGRKSAFRGQHRPPAQRAVAEITHQLQTGPSKIQRNKKIKPQHFEN